MGNKKKPLFRWLKSMNKFLELIRQPYYHPVVIVPLR